MCVCVCLQEEEREEALAVHRDEGQRLKEQRRITVVQVSFLRAAVVGEPPTRYEYCSCLSLYQRVEDNVGSTVNRSTENRQSWRYRSHGTLSMQISHPPTPPMTSLPNFLLNGHTTSPACKLAKIKT